MKKLKAFTLTELLVAMVVSAIVIAVAYQIYSIASMQFGEYKKVNDKISNEVVLKGLLNMDFFTSTAVLQRSENSIEIHKQDTLIEYAWNEFFVLRTKNNMRDTFFLEVESSELRFKNKAQKQGGLVDELELVSKDSGAERVFCFFKEYSADVLMRNENGIHE